MTSQASDIKGFTPFPTDRAAEYRRRGYWRGVRLDSILRDAATNWPERTAVIDPLGAITFADLDTRADRSAAGLIDLGIRPGDRVLLQLPNSTAFAVALFALLRAGGRRRKALSPEEETVQRFGRELFALLFDGETLAHYLPRWRAAHDHSLREAAALIGVTHSLWQGWEGGTQPDAKNHALLEALTGIARAAWDSPDLNARTAEIRAAAGHTANDFTVTPRDPGDPS